jgi:ABC-type transport system involved in cytochrome c biogenesis permease subunit
MIKKTLDNSFHFWRQIINFWTIVFMIFIVYDFINNNLFTEVIGPLAAIYIGVLAIYVGNKEFERWYDIHKSKHPGELYVIAWTLLVFIIIALNVILQKEYKLPSGVVSSYLAVLTILVITNKSKTLYRRKK